MPTPATTGRTLWLDASDTDRLWTDAGMATTHPGDGGAVAAWDDEGDATDSAAIIESLGQEPLYRANGINGLGSVDFDGVDNYLRMRTDADSANKPISTYFTASAWTIFIVFEAQGAGGTNASAHNNSPLIHNILDVAVGLYVEQIGGVDQVTLRHSDFVTAVELSKTISLNTGHVVMARREGGNLYISLDNGAESSIAHGDTGSLTQGLRIGGNSSGPDFFDGMIGEILFYNTALTGTDFSDTYEYLTEKWLNLPLQRVTQLVMTYGYNRYVDADPPPVEDPCTGGGTVASGSNPSDGTALTTATALHAWIETTIGATTYRWAKVGINHGNPKTPRVLSFGKLTAALSDDNGGFESASMRILLSDYDRALRGLHVTQTLMNQSVSVYVADEATIRAGGNPWRVFRGVVRDFRPESELKYRITIEDPLTLAMSAFSQEKLVPPALISVSDGTADQGLRQAPAPRLYGALSEDNGAIELPFIGTQTPVGHAELGNRHRHLVGLGAIGNITAVFRGDPESGTPPTTRTAALESEYEDDILAPHISPGWYESELYLVIDDQRWTILDLDQNHPAADIARYGRIPLTANVCGIETVGDGTGATINSLPRQALHVLNNDVAQTVGDEDWKAIATRDGYALFDTASFETAKTVSEGRISAGYRGAWVLGHSFKQITLRDLLRQLSLSGNFDFGINRHGQIMVTMLDRAADTSSLTHFTDTSDILKDSFSIDPRLDVIENRIRYAYRRNYVDPLQLPTPEQGGRLPQDSFKKTWLSDVQTLDNTTEQTALGEVRESKVLELEMVRDEDVAADIAAQRLALRSPSNGRAEASFDVTLGRGHSVELGQLVKVTHFQGLGASGWSANVCQVRRREVDLDRFTVSFTVRDVDDLMGESEVDGLVIGDNPLTLDGDPIVL